LHDTSASGLIWYDDKGHGFYLVTRPAAYDQAYFDKYVGYAKTELGELLTSIRVALVNKHLPLGMPLIDVGVGCGQFLESMARFRPCHGYDVNPVAVQMLKDTGRWRDPYETDPLALTFWDSFEHIAQPANILARQAAIIFMSLPVFHNRDHVLRSRHFRPDEHFWYFTNWGLVRVMDQMGYRCIEMNYHETSAGREDIGTFVFVRHG